jgi:hypothetical protein
MLKKYIFITLPIIVLSITACRDNESSTGPGTSGTPQNQYQIDSVSIDDINDGIDSVKKNSGGILQLPAGEFHLGNTTFCVPAGVKIVGAGKSNTILYDAVFNFDNRHGSCGDNFCQLSSLTIKNSYSAAGNYFEVNRLAGMRIDNCYIEGRYSTFCNVNSTPLLVDHCEFRLYVSYGFYCFDKNNYYKNTRNTYSGQFNNSEAYALIRYSC